VLFGSDLQYDKINVLAIYYSVTERSNLDSTEHSIFISLISFSVLAHRSNNKNFSYWLIMKVYSRSRQSWNLVSPR